MQAIVDRLNTECFCVGLDRDALARAFESELGQPGLHELVRERCPHAFATRPVFVSPRQAERISAVVRAVDAVVALPAYREEVLARAPEIARHDPGGARGVFFGYDFHLAGDRLGLIEINTNAGGAMLNAAMAHAHVACCSAVTEALPPSGSRGALESAILPMFHDEWRLSGADRPLRTIAIVDERPEGQYLYPEFLLFQRLFERHGLRAIVADPSELSYRRGALWHGDVAVDLVYNRLTDFALETPASAALRQAYLERAVVLTPHPRAHALYADKRNLALLSDEGALRAVGAPEPARAVLLASVPRTRIVRADDAEQLWQERRGLFFKPEAGFGSRAAYRGDKLTRRVWQEIVAGGYVAQEIVAPGERVVDHDAHTAALKFDVRAYVYDATVQALAARLYQGQTTNFRTPGGGFAPIHVVGHPLAP